MKWIIDLDWISFLYVNIILNSRSKNQKQVLSNAMYLGDFVILKENMEYGILAIISRFVNTNEDIDYIIFLVVGNQD